MVLVAEVMYVCFYVMLCSFISSLVECFRPFSPVVSLQLHLRKPISELGTLKHVEESCRRPIQENKV